MNNFQKLQQEDEERYKPEVDQLRNQLDNNMDLFRLIGNIIDIYVPRFFDMMVVTTGGESGKKTPPPHENPGASGQRDPDGPGGPSDLDPGRR